MRKERDERARLTSTIKKDQPSSQSPVGLDNIGNLMQSMSSTDADKGEMELITPGGGGGGGGGGASVGSRGRSNNKKKKKGKR